MQNFNGNAAAQQQEADSSDSGDRRERVSTHVLISEEQVGRLRELSRRTRVAQSEYLREAIDDLLRKYGCLPTEPKE
jgi:hypothetical protein